MTIAYRHLDNKGLPIALPVGKAVCVGRNYLDHVQELNNEVPEQALLFIKPSTSFVPFAEAVTIPSGQGPCHNELELALLIGKPLKNATPQQAMEAIWGVGLALDLTLREVQDSLKAKGQPWERAKAFDGSCPLSGFVPAQQLGDLQQLGFSLEVNGVSRQRGDARLMIRDIPSLLCEISHCFTLEPGDLVLTGTPKGVGPLNPGDALNARLDGHLQAQAKVQHA
ncbi:fumarylacetoacetate hydrolase family protein [Aliiglaciecola sp. CAU 1673]|uniref:fumarylacetoacetate hydrolase family protein n=1 Tax=Aliiglaciecola sp. CAU 1673 TaxID=3032595 RepID=UPI0023DBC011|nr:fumarylacetoacetate hydrolase family protein [Aliiglaciecola sp. CAU 1673]MDF2179829.1 fumarylacetoacetate hydrolase family protein [Aliiglaciecola sp. CAU 1673]